MAKTNILFMPKGGDALRRRRGVPRSAYGRARTMDIIHRHEELHGRQAGNSAVLQKGTSPYIHSTRSMYIHYIRIIHERRGYNIEDLSSYCRWESSFHLYSLVAIARLSFVRRVGKFATALKAHHATLYVYVYRSTRICVCVCVCVCADARVYSRYTSDARDASAKDAGRAHTGTCRGYRKDVRRVQRSDFAGMAGEKAFSASTCVLANWPAREVKYFCFDFGGVFSLCIYIYRRVEWGALCLKGERGILLKWR